MAVSAVASEVRQGAEIAFSVAFFGGVPKSTRAFCIPRVRRQLNAPAGPLAHRGPSVEPLLLLFLTARRVRGRHVVIEVFRGIFESELYSCFSDKGGF